MDTLIGFGLPLALLLVGLTAGQITEMNHFARLKRREEETQGVILSNVKNYVLNRKVQESRLVTGHVVISTDYFKSICASLRRLVGGRIISYEKLVERGRREQHQVDRRRETEDHREQELQRCLVPLLVRQLAPLQANLIGKVLKCGSDACPV